MTEYELARRFGKVVRHYYRIVRAIDEREVKPNRPRKSIGADYTFNKDLETEQEMLAKHLWQPISRVPDPYGEHESYAAGNIARFEKELEEELDE